MTAEDARAYLLAMHAQETTTVKMLAGFYPTDQVVKALAESAARVDVVVTTLALLESP